MKTIFFLISMCHRHCICISQPDKIIIIIWKRNSHNPLQQCSASILHQNIIIFRPLGYSKMSMRNSFLIFCQIPAIFSKGIFNCGTVFPIRNFHIIKWCLVCDLIFLFSVGMDNGITYIQFFDFVKNSTSF